MKIWLTPGRRLCGCEPCLGDLRMSDTTPSMARVSVELRMIRIPPPLSPQGFAFCFLYYLFLRRGWRASRVSKLDLELQFLLPLSQAVPGSPVGTTIACSPPRWGWKPCTLGSTLPTEPHPSLHLSPTGSWKTLSGKKVKTKFLNLLTVQASPS